MHQHQVRKLNESKQEVINRIVDRLKRSIASITTLHEKKEAGEDARFYDSNVTGVMALVDTLSDTNITNDPDLEKFYDQATEIFTKYGRDTADLIKQSPIVREQVIEESSDLLSAIEQYSPTKFGA